jgi:hypothetical protein
VFDASFRMAGRHIVKVNVFFLLGRIGDSTPSKDAEGNRPA